MLTILLTRHGKTPQSEPEQYLGQTMDVELSDEGRSTAAALRDRLDGVRLARVVASPLRRAMETAAIIAPGHEVEPDGRLIEADYGEWEGHTREQIRTRWPEIRAAWEADPAANGPPGGENGNQIEARARSLVESLIAWESALQRTDEEHRVLLVGHSTVNRVLLAWRLRAPIREYRVRFRQDWTNLTVIRDVSTDGGLLVLDNDVSHIKGIRGATWE